MASHTPLPLSPLIRQLPTRRSATVTDSPTHAVVVQAPIPHRDPRDVHTPVRVTLIRHAESVMNTRPHLIGGRSNETPLSALGQRQAEALRDHLAARGAVYDACYASPAVRARETALIALGSAARITIAPQIQELSQGEWEGQPRAVIYTPELLARIRASDGTLRPPDGESPRDVQERMVLWLDEVAHRHGPTAGIVAFSHGYAIRALVGRIAGWDFNTVFDKQAPNTSMTVVIKNAGDWQLDSFSDAEHLAGIAAETPGVIG